MVKKSLYLGLLAIHDKMNVRCKMKELPRPFNYYRMVLDSDHLHFGLWPDDQPKLSLEQAQEQMFKTLLSYFPNPPASVLDIGSGLGKSAFELAQRGYQVTAISPSEKLINYAKSYYNHPNIVFHNLGYLECKTVFGSELFDVLLFQESLQYLHPLDQVFQLARRLLKPKGRIIIGDEIRYDTQLQEVTAVHLLSDILIAMLRNGFRLKVDQRIGKSVHQTCDHIIQRFVGNFDHLVLNLNHGYSQDSQESLAHFLTGWRQQKKWYENGQFDYCLLMARKDEIFCQEYQPGDEHDILKLFKQVFLHKRTLEHWYWKFRDNPFGQLKIAKAVTKDGRLAAHFSGYPVVFHSNVSSESELLTLQVGDTMTNPEFRGCGLGLTSVLSRIANFFYNRFCRYQVPFIYGFNTGNIRKFGTRYLSYQYISSIPYHVLEVNRLTSSPLKSYFQKIISGYSIERVTSFDQEFDVFFQRISKDYDLLVKRTSTYLNWRYIQCPDGIYHLYAIRKFGKLVGWSAFILKDKTLLWGDALFDRKYPKSVLFFLQRLVQSWYPNILSIEGWFSPVPEWWTKILENIGFECRQEPNNLAPVFVFFDPNWSKGLFESHFYYTMADSDLF